MESTASRGPDLGLHDLSRGYFGRQIRGRLGISGTFGTQFSAQK